MKILLSLWIVFLLALSLLLPQNHAQADSQVAALTEAENMRRCPVDKKDPLPSHVTRAATTQQDIISSKSTIVVPVHVHILQDTAGRNPISQFGVDATLSRLNAGFATAGFYFQLSSIETVVNDSWARVSRANRAVLDDAAAALNTGGRDAANVYITYLEGLCGLASLPYSQEPTEAVFLDYRCIPSGIASDSYDTVIHEMGHFMGLLHTFAPEPNGCRGKGDYVSDTPFQKTPHFRCKRYDTCPKKRGLDPVRNYMDYTGDSCRHRFSKGQIALMRYAHSYYRLN